MFPDKSWVMVIVCGMFLSGCKKLVEVNNPDTTISDKNVYSTDATAIAAVTGIYTQMSAGIITDRSVTSLSLFSGLSADELTLYSGVTDPTYVGYYLNALTGLNLGNSDPWSVFYPMIFSANAAIEGLEKSNALTAAIKTQLDGEAKFIRAFAYFYLVNFYGDVPLIVSTDYIPNSTVARAPQSTVWAQIVSDLQEAQNKLDSQYLDGSLLATTSERVRPTRWACKALLARTYLYIGDWANAEKTASSVIDSTMMYSLPELDQVFLKNNPEAIWQLQPVKSDFNTWDAWLFVLPDSGPNTDHPVFMSRFLLHSFEDSDHRRREWVDSVVVDTNVYYFPFKYKVSTPGAPVSEYEMVFRLAEQYLIRAEARAQQNNLSGAEADLNKIRDRANLPPVNAVSRDSLLTIILHERQVELFTEWGHRWLDLKRTKNIDNVMDIVTPQKGGKWQSYKQLYPIPLSEVQRDPNLTQTPGY